LVLGQPVDSIDLRRRDRQRAARPDHQPPLFRLDPDDVQRLGPAPDLDPAPLADGEMDHALMLPEYLSVEIDDLARRGRFGPEPLDQSGVGAVSDKTDVL